MSDSNLSANSVPLGRAYEILEDNSTFGGYTILRCLAYDMLGSLYLALNRQSNQRETLFVFPSLVSQDKEFHERFLNHTKKLCSISHANLLNFSRPLIIHNSYCLVGEHFEGLNIPDHLSLLTGSQLSTTENTETANLPPAQVTPILEQVLTALDYGYQCKVMHLNLNPTKILRSSYGEVKVYGFHFLAILGQELFEMLVSAGIPPLKTDPKRSFLGTTDILSPEARLRTPLEYRSDVYAIGVDTHWLLTGRKPTSPYKPPSHLVPHIEPGWDAFIIHCLQRKLEDRYPTAAAALADLRNLAQLTPVTAAQPLELMLAPEPEVLAPRKKGDTKSPVKKSKPVKPPRKPRKPLTKVQRLLLMAIPAVLAVALGAFMYMNYESVLASDDDELDLAMRAKPGQTPRLHLTIAPHNALINIRPGKSIFTVNDGELPLNISKGKKIIDIEATGYKTLHLPYTVTSDPDHLFINLEPNWAQVDFTTVPGATVRALPAKGDPIYLGVAPESGNLHVTKGLVAGNYTFEATKDQYQPATVTGTGLELGKSYTFTLRPVAKPATVTLTSEPPGATVRIGDKVMGKTPLTTSDVPVDTDVTLTLEQQGYRPVQRTIRVGPSETREFSLGNLSAKTGEISLAYTIGGHAPTPEEQRDTKIIINNQPYPGATRRIPNVLESPSYHVVFQNPNYFPAEQTVAVQDGQVAAVQADLLPRPAHVLIRTSPVVPVNVLLDGRPMRLGADGGLDLPPDQTAKLKVEAQNYAGSAREFKLGPNQSETWDVPLQVLPGPTVGQNYTVPYLNLAMNWIPAGNYTMGSPGGEPERRPSEGDPTQVTIPVGFWAGRYEVTQNQYRAIMNENPSEFGRNAQGNDQFPVDKVSWKKAVEFARQLTDREVAAKRVPDGYEYRLPTEAEWEYFARAGVTSAFPGGDHADQTDGNFVGTYPRAAGSAVTSSNTYHGTKPVGSYKENAFGLFDVQGNVGEWVLDAYNSRLPGVPVTAPALRDGDDRSKRFYRGGSWSDFAAESRLAYRDPGVSVSPDTVSNKIGFRLVLAPKIARVTP